MENNLKLLGYIYGSKIGKNSTFKYSDFLVTPIIVIPAYNRNVNTRKNYNETRIQNVSTNFGGIILDSDDDIEVNFRQALEMKSLNKTSISGLNKTENLNQTENATNDVNKMKTASQTQVVIFDNSTSKENDMIRNTTSSNMDLEAHYLYPNANYNNNAVQSLSITIEQPDQILQPPLSDEKWQNFSASNNINLKELSLTLNITNKPAENETESPIIGVYAAARYDNTEVEQLSITTNSYTNVLPLPPSQDDRSQNSASMKQQSQASNEFRPLAGLYYDGFLHKPILKTQEFVPYNHYT